GASIPPRPISSPPGRARERRGVGQIFNLPYRPIVFGRALDRSQPSEFAVAKQSATLRYGMRYGRVQLCATMEHGTTMGCSFLDERDPFIRASGFSRHDSDSAGPARGDRRVVSRAGPRFVRLRGGLAGDGVGLCTHHLAQASHAATIGRLPVVYLRPPASDADERVDLRFRRANRPGHVVMADREVGPGTAGPA